MSHQEMATIEYANACKEMLDDAQLRIDEAISNIDAIVAGSSKLMDPTLESMVDDLHRTAKEISKSIAGKRLSIGNAAYRDAIDSTHSFVSKVNVVTLKADALSSAIDSALQSRLDKTSQRKDVEVYISSVSDQRVARMMKLLSRNKKHSNLSPQDLQALAESKLDPTKKVDIHLMKDTVESIQTRMEKEKLSSDVIDKVVSVEDKTSPLEMMNAATNEIIDERLRKSAVQAIVNCITKKGFVVERKNIRHIRETDTVKITAIKPGGQTAEFSIDLHGKFIYHFQGYEGKACEKDITPMEEDLEKIYGIKLTERKTLWENPDKINQSHHREMKVRRDS